MVDTEEEPYRYSPPYKRDAILAGLSILVMVVCLILEFQ